MAMKPGEADQLRAFLGSLLTGAAEFGMKAYPLVKMYERAQAEKIDFWELVLTDESTTAHLTKAMEKHMAKLSPSVIAGLRLVLNARQQHDLRKKQEAEAMAASKAKAATAPTAATVGGNRAEDV